MSSFLAQYEQDDYSESESDYYEDDYYEDDNEAEAEAPGIDLEKFEKEQETKRKMLEEQKLGLGEARESIQDNDCIPSFVQQSLANEEARKERAKKVILRAPLFSDGTMRWEPVSIGKGNHALRISAACALIKNVSLKSKDDDYVAVYGGRQVDGKHYGDGVLLKIPHDGLPNDEKLVIDTQNLSSRGAKPFALVGHTLSYAVGRDSLLVIGGAVRNGVRKNEIVPLPMPRSTLAHWGVLHKAVPHLAKMEADHTLKAQHLRNVRLCECVQERRSYGNPFYNSSYYHPRLRKMIEEKSVFDDHWCTPKSEDMIPVSGHSSTVVGDVIYLFGGRTTGGKINNKLLVVRTGYSRTLQRVWQGGPTGGLHMRTFKPSYIDASYELLRMTAQPQDIVPPKRRNHKSKKKHENHYVYEPTSGHAAVISAHTIYLIGGVSEKSEPISDIYAYDIAKDEMSLFALSAGRLPPLAFHSATVVKNKMVIFGGVTRNQVPLNHIYIVSIATQAVDQLVITQGIPPAPRSRHCSMLVGKDLLIFGGQTKDGGVGDAVVLRDIGSMRTQESFVQSFESLLNSERHSDVLFVNAQTKIHTHRVILVARCGFFRRLLLEEAVSQTLTLSHLSQASGEPRTLKIIKNANKNNVDSVLGQTFTLMIDAPHTELMTFFRFLYTDTVDIKECNVEALINLARDFECDDLVALCQTLSDDSIVVPPSTFVGDFRQVLNARALADVVFTLGARSVYAHRAILVHRCPYFATLLGGNFREATEQTVAIHDYEPELFIAALLFLYSGIIDSTNPQQVFELLYVSNFWNVNDLKVKCEAFLLDYLDQENCCLFYEAGVENNCSSSFLEQVAVFIKQHYGALIGGHDAERFLDDVVRVRVAEEERVAEVPDHENHNPVVDGWIPRTNIDVCSTCSLPFYYDPKTWKGQTPITVLTEWASKHKQPEPVYNRVVDPMAIGHRINVQLPHLPVSHQLVKLLRSFRTKKLAQQNAALCALHHKHLVEEKLTK